MSGEDCDSDDPMHEALHWILDFASASAGLMNGWIRGHPFPAEPREVRA